ncbi:hypothetical protein BT69DRAFT_1353532 [Atractiella rhizophila]|nr:hypothetical protein BT69DRAFT_1353532 [Atractiella rhizophila]
MPGLFRAFLALPPSSLWLHLLQPLANFTHDMDFMVKKRIDPNVIDKFLWTIISGFVVALLLSRPFKVSKRLLNRCYRLCRRQVVIHILPYFTSPLRPPRRIRADELEVTADGRNSVLPPEILFQIFLHLPKDALASLAHVCLFWRASAERALYRSIRLRSLKQSVMLYHHFNRYPSKGLFVTHLDLTYFGQCGHSAGRYARRLERLLGQLKGLKEVVVSDSMVCSNVAHLTERSERAVSASFIRVLQENVSILRVEKMDLFLARTNVQWPAGHVALDLSSPSAYNEKVELATFPYLRVLRISGHPVHILTTAPILLPHASGLSKLFVQGGTDLALIYPLLFGSCDTLTSLTLTGYFSFNQAQIDDLGSALRRCGYLRFMRLEHNWLYAAISDLDRQVPNVSPLIEGVTGSPFLEELIVKIEHTPPDLLVKSLPPSLRILGISLLPSMQPRSVLSHLRTRMSRLSNLQTLKLYPTYRQAGEYLKGIDAEAAGLGLVVKIYRLDHLSSAKWWTYQFKMDDEQEEEKDTMSELSWRWFTKSE